MNKKVMSSLLLLCATLFVALTANAQGRRGAGQAPQRGDAPEAMAPMMCDSAACCLLFEGIDLTDAQKAKLQELQKARAEKQQANASADRQKAREERMEAMKAEKREYLNEVKKVLTADQYVTFLENAFMQQPRMGAPMQQPRSGKQGRKAAARGQRPERQQAPEAAQ